MKQIRLNKRTVLAGILGCSTALSWAQDVEEPPEAPTLSPGEQKVVEKIAGDFEDFAGEDAQSLVEALRNGTDWSYDIEKEVEVEVPVLDENMQPVYKTEVDPETGDDVQVLDAEGNPIPLTTTETQIEIETILVENSAGPMGFGNAKITMLLAEEMLARQSLEGSVENITGAFFGTDPALADGILEMREAGAGWGEISRELLDTNLGSLMSGKNKGGAPDGGLDDIPGDVPDGDAGVASVERAEKVAKGGPKADRGGRPDGVGKVEKVSKPVKIEKPDKPGRASKPERVERPVKFERPSRPSRPDRPARPDRPTRPERPAKPDRPNR